jgi:hypothetical protein
MPGAFNAGRWREVRGEDVIVARGRRRLDVGHPVDSTHTPVIGGAARTRFRW